MIITKKIPVLIYSLLFTACIMQRSVQAFSDAHKWAYVHRVLEKQDKKFASDAHKLGRCLDNHAAFFSMPVGAIAVLQGALFSMSKSVFSHNGQANFFVGGLIGGTAGSLIAYKVCKALGEMLQDRPVVCQRLITSYVAQWPEHKENTPEELAPMFDTMYTNFIAHDGKVSAIDESQAIVIVENILALSVLASAVR